MNTHAPFAVVRNPELIAWAGVAFFAAIFLGLGIYVVSGRWAAGRPKRDEKAIARWDKAQREGFWRASARGSLLAWSVYFYLGAWIKAWRLEETLVLPAGEIFRLALQSLVVGLAFGAADWWLIRQHAEEVHDRAARTQDQETLRPPTSRESDDRSGG